MSRSISNTAKVAINSAQTNEAFLILLTIDHDDLANPIRVTSDAVETISNGNTFVPFPFELTLPNEDDRSAPRARIRIDNIDRQIITAIRSISGAPTILMQIVLASSPNTIEAEFPDFKLENTSYDAMMVEGDLVIEEFSSEPYPAGVFSPADFPGLF